MKCQGGSVIVAGKYQLGDVLARGARTLVFRAHHLLTGREVALKLLPRRQRKLPAARARLLREGRLTVTARHPNVIDVLDMGCEAQEDIYIATELIDGPTLAHPRRARRDLRQLTEWALPLLASVSRLHRLGLVHARIWPEHVMLAKVDGVISTKLLGFGEARWIDAAPQPVYVRGRAPEQQRGWASTFASDVWALGALLYGDLVRGADGLPCAIDENVRPLVKMRPDLPKAFAAVVDGALHQSAPARWADASELEGALLWSLREAELVAPAKPSTRRANEGVEALLTQDIEFLDASVDGYPLEIDVQLTRSGLRALRFDRSPPTI